jgi:hypothetical protein
MAYVSNALSQHAQFAAQWGTYHGVRSQELLKFFPTFQSSDIDVLLLTKSSNWQFNDISFIFQLRLGADA